MRYLGEDVSRGLHSRTHHHSVATTACPPLADAKALADAMGVPLGELRFLAFSRKVASVNALSALHDPQEERRRAVDLGADAAPQAAQHWVLDNILARGRAARCRARLRPERSILTNARAARRPRRGDQLNLKDFFPTVTYSRVKGVCSSARLRRGGRDPRSRCCAPSLSSRRSTLDGERYFIADGPRRLPQGAPTSPAITNADLPQARPAHLGLARTARVRLHAATPTI